MGNDNAEKIRNFIRHAHNTWQTQYVLLAGDVDIIPVRWVLVKISHPDVSAEGAYIPTDRYYSSLNGDWDANKNGIFGEAGDSVDLTPLVYVGRAPVNTVEDAHTFIRKVIQYSEPVSADYLDKVLFVGGSYWESTKLNVASIVPERLKLRILLESDGTAYSWFDSLNTGFNVVNVAGSSQWWCFWLGGYHSREDVDNLTNSKLFVMFAPMTCWLNACDFDCIGEHFLNNPQGGACAVIAKTRFGYDIGDNEIDYQLIDNLYNKKVRKLGKLLNYAIESIIPYAGEDNWYRESVYCLILLGDPTMNVWVDEPLNLNVVHNDSIPLGGSILQVSVFDTVSEPVESALVTVSNLFDSYARVYTDSEGVASFFYKPQKPCTLDIAVVHPDFLPYYGKCVVIPYDIYVYCDSVYINDSTGNCNNELEPFEQVKLYFRIKNLDSPVNDLIVQGNFENATVLKNSDTLNLNTPFDYAWTEMFVKPEKAGYIKISLAYLLNDSTVNVDTVLLPVYHDSLELTQYKLDLKGDIFTIHNVEVTNYGTGQADSVYIIVRTDDATLLDSECFIGNIEPMSSKTSDDAIEFVYSPDTVNLQFWLYSKSEVYVNNVQVLPIDTIYLDSSLEIIRSIDKYIELRWQAHPDAFGYNVYRRSENDTFVRINNILVKSPTAFHDESINPYENYFYEIGIVNKNRVEISHSKSVYTKSGYPILSGFPKTIPICEPGNTFSSPVAEDIDGDGYKEIIAAIKDSIFVWRYTGELCEGFPQKIMCPNSTPAVADINDDGKCEILLISCDTIYMFDYTGSKLWYKPYTGYGWITPPSPVICDVNHDGKKEIIILEQEELNIFTSYGEVLDGFPVQLRGKTLATPGMGEIDNQYYGEEIAIAWRSADSGGVTIFHADGSEFWTRIFHREEFNKCSVVGSPVVVDIDGDEIFEIVALLNFENPGVYPPERYSLLIVLDDNGDTLWSKFFHSGWVGVLGGSPAVADVTDNGTFEIVLADCNEFVHVYDKDGNVLLEERFAEKVYGTPSIADIDGDGKYEIIFPESDRSNKVFCVRVDGTQAPGTPLYLYDSGSQNSPCLADLDGDGDIELVIYNPSRKLFVFDLPGDANSIRWAMFHFDAQNTGRVISPIFESKKEYNKVNLIPNPAFGSVRLCLSIKEPCKLNIVIYDVAGRLINQLYKGYLSYGDYEFTWTGCDMQARKCPSGVYFFKIQGDINRTYKIILLK